MKEGPVSFAHARRRISPAFLAPRFLPEMYLAEERKEGGKDGRKKDIKEGRKGGRKGGGRKEGRT